MPKKQKKTKQQATVERAAIAATRNQRIDSFEPDLRMPEIRMCAAEDEYSELERPMTEEERASDAQRCEEQAHKLTLAMDADAQRRQKLPFTGSVYECTMQVAREAEAAGAHEMERHIWTQWHEKMYAKHLPFSSSCYKLFRRAAEGRSLEDPEFVKNLLIGRMRERGRLSNDKADKLASVHNTKTHMYTAMRANVEKEAERQRATSTNGKVAAQ